MLLMPEGQDGKEEEPGNSHGVPEPGSGIYCDLPEVHTFEQTEGAEA